MHVNLDPLLVDKIANEVKSQGVFDQFRKDSMADVDTKPAYQNLRQRVENTVNKFLSAQIWTPDMNKNQLREKLRKHITEAGFLDVGVERIVDQVVNPKIATVFQPKIEDIAYKYLGIPKPQPTVVTSTDVAPLNGILKIETDLLPTDLEQVSPDSDKCTVKSDSKDEMDIDEKIDEFESPAFEPIEKSDADRFKLESKLELKPKLEEEKDVKQEDVVPVAPPPRSFSFNQYQSNAKDENSSEDWDADEQNQQPTPEPSVKNDEVALRGNVSPSGDATQETQLSQVSSDSRLSIVTNGNTQDDHSTACEIKEENNVNISEEAQMPKFNENSNSCPDQKPSEPLHFDIKKDEIKFEGTERKQKPPSEGTSPNISDEQRVDSSMENKTIDTSEMSDVPLPSHEFSFEKDSDFKFSKIEVKVDLEEASKTTSLDDSADRDLLIIEKSEFSQCSMSQASNKSLMPRPKSPSATSSPLHLHHTSSNRDKDRDQSSRHKKYSKDKRSDRDKDKYSSSSHKSSSRHHSSKSSSSHHHHHHRSSSSSVHKSKSSSRYGKSSRSYHDSKESSHSHDRDRSKSRSDKPREKSSKEKSDRSKVSNDDHYSSKNKWRKSTDSNDEDSSQEGSQPRGPKDSSNSQDNATNGTPNNSSTSSGTSNANNPNGKGSSNVMESSQTCKLAEEKIASLENPEASSIEIVNSCVQVNSMPNDQTTKPCSYNGESLFYFENDFKTKEDVEIRMNILTNMMENFRHILKSSLESPREPSATESESGTASLETDTSSFTGQLKALSPAGNSVGSPLNSPSKSTPLTSATLTIDCIEYGGPSMSHCLSKRFKYDDKLHTKVSPTPSELSVNSKENEFIDKNSQSDSDSLGSRGTSKSEINKAMSTVEKRKAILNRNQRYSSEDLYKPRPILSQRSRRRGLDAIN